MQRYPVRKHRWAVILAGGEGVRLRSLTRFVSGDDRPKQFCPLINGRTLLAQTQQRIASAFLAGQTVFALLKSHERFYQDHMKHVPSSRTVVQPSSRGTLPAILSSLLRVVQMDSEAIVAFFPSDHHYTEEDRFMAGVEFAFEAAVNDPDALILLGAAAKYPEVEYGWIEAEAAAYGGPRSGLLRIKHFWEKPTLCVAQDLLDRGCIWNTFIMVGRAQTFLDVIRWNAPIVSQAFESVRIHPGAATATEDLEAVYARVPEADFSRLVLSADPARFSVFSLGDVGWSDLGDPRRAISALDRKGAESTWMRRWRVEQRVAVAAAS